MRTCLCLCVCVNTELGMLCVAWAFFDLALSLVHFKRIPQEKKVCVCARGEGKKVGKRGAEREEAEDGGEVGEDQ